MPVNNRIAVLADEVTGWRQAIHRHPELLYEVHRTAAFVADKLRSFGCDEVVTGIGRTGVVALVHGRVKPGNKVIGLRADMDALPIHEANDLPHRSQIEGRMHACGHDGHTAMLLGAARYLAETRNFAGTVALIFQPAEEGGGGGKAMVDDGLMERFSISEVFGLHNMPGLPVGSFAIRPGPMMAAADRFTIEIEGRGGHAAKPHECIDPVLVGAQIVVALQAIVARGTDPLDSGVVSVTRFQAGHADNVIPQSARLSGTVRTLRAETRDFAEARLREIVHGLAQAHRARAEIRYDRGYPITENHAEQTRMAIDVAGTLFGRDKVDESVAPTMGAEDFSYMLLARPGAFIFAGNGNTAGLHHPKYDFNDALIPIGISFWAKLVETALPA
jgi:amidohydrolase